MVRISTGNLINIINQYPTLVEHYEYVSESSLMINYELYVIYKVGKILMVDVYSREQRPTTIQSLYIYAYSESFVKLLLQIEQFYTSHYYYVFPILERIYYKEITKKYYRKIINWLWKSREQIVKREMHPDRIRSLLDSGIELDDIESTIESKLAGKLSYDTF